MGKLKIKKQKIQKNSIPAPLNVTNFTMEQISRQTGVRIESLKAYLNAREQEIKEQLIKESLQKEPRSKQIYVKNMEKAKSFTNTMKMPEKKMNLRRSLFW